ncbi:hypothetical protein ULF88_10530 [Halopseudomonas pachastrellae]|nr:hypothetical protein [Halopseudomonas pachastrellae]
MGTKAAGGTGNQGSLPVRSKREVVMDEVSCCRCLGEYAPEYRPTGDWVPLPDGWVMMVNQCWRVAPAAD